MVPGAVLPQMQVFALALVELDEVPVSPFLQPVEVSGAAVGNICHSFLFCVICRLSKGLFVHQVINEGAEQNGTWC